MEYTAPSRLQRVYPLAIETCRLLHEDLQNGSCYQDLEAHGLADPLLGKIFLIEAWVATIAKTVPGVTKTNVDSVVEAVDYFIRFYGKYCPQAFSEHMGRILKPSDGVRLLWLGDQDMEFMKLFFPLFVSFITKLDPRLVSGYIKIDEDSYLTDQP